jgi:hypothetical protein
LLGGRRCHGVQDGRRQQSVVLSHSSLCLELRLRNHPHVHHSAPSVQEAARECGFPTITVSRRHAQSGTDKRLSDRFTDPPPRSLHRCHITCPFQCCARRVYCKNGNRD